jgi:hypothetical protein
MDFRFRHHLIDTDLPRGTYAQTALADLDNDGRLEYIVGQTHGTVYWYKRHSPERWTRHVLGLNSPSDVGGTALDVDGDGWTDFVAGGAWYRNSRSPERPFERIVFDPELSAVHDVVTADLDGDGRMEVVTMSDRNSLRGYKIPEDPTRPWRRTEIGAPVHAGVAVGDIDGDGDLDIVRSTVWFENARGDGSEWVEHPLGPTTPPPPDFRPAFAFNATRAAVVDMNRDGKNDIVQCDCEIPGGKIWWMENLDGKGRSWRRHEVPNGDAGRRGAYHGLHVADFDRDGDLDLFACEMEAVAGEGNPRYYLWENGDGNGLKWREHVILDANLGGHEPVVGDITGSGRLDIIAKPWRPRPENALGGKMFVVLLENVSRR